MNAFTTFAPRARRDRQMIEVELWPHELYLLIRGLEQRATETADAGFDEAADLLFMRVAELREAGR